MAKKNNNKKNSQLEVKSLMKTLFFLRWNDLLEQISEQLRSSKALLGLWQQYTELFGTCVKAVERQEERVDRLLKSATDRDITEEESSAWIKDCDVSTRRTRGLHRWISRNPDKTPLIYDPPPPTEYKIASLPLSVLEWRVDSPVQQKPLENRETGP